MSRHVRVPTGKPAGSFLSEKAAIALTIALPAAGVIFGSVVGSFTSPPPLVRVGALGLTTGLELSALAIVLFPHLINASNSGNRWKSFGIMLSGFVIAAALFLLLRAFVNRWKPDDTQRANWPVLASIIADFISDGIVIGIAAATDPWRTGIAIMVAYFIDGFFLAFTQLAESKKASIGSKIAIPIVLAIARVLPAVLVYLGARNLVQEQSFESKPWGQFLLGFALASYVTVVEGLSRETMTTDSICVVNKAGKEVVDPETASTRSLVAMGFFLFAVIVMVALAWRGSATLIDSKY